MRETSKTQPFIIDLSKIGGSGTFNCPRCKTTISPEDKSDQVYTILEPIMKNDHLEKLMLQCNKCGSHIQLVGFDILDN